MKIIKIKTPAKLNLVLQVLNKRNDGYHNIKSIMHKINLFDRLTISVKKSNGLSVDIKSTGFRVPLGKDNLCYKAIKILSENIDGLNAEKLKKTKITVKITKNIPVSSGLAGGSSNAAGVLICLNKLLNLNLNLNELVKIASRIGSDVPFFLYKNPACYVEKKGEKIRSFPALPETYAILVKPDFNISTKWAYDGFDRKYKNKKLTKKTNFIKIAYQLIKEGDANRIAKSLHNDLEPVVANKYRQIYKIKKRLIKLGASGSIMSGSGSTVFGLIANESKAKQIYYLLKNSKETRKYRWWVKKIKIAPN